MRLFLRKNKLALLVVVLLFFTPFFWHSAGEMDYGGDSTRLYFYDPVSWLNNIALYFVSNLVPLGGAMPNFSLVPFLSILIFIKKILFFGDGSLLNNLINGTLLSGGFVSIYIIIEELFPNNAIQQKSNLPNIISGLFFVFSPILIFQWERALYSIHQIFLYPLIFLLFLKYLKSGSYKFLVVISLLICIFALNFSFPSFPWLIAFFSFSFMFLFIYSFLSKRRIRFLKGITIIFFLFLLLNSFDIIPQIYYLINPASGVSIDKTTMESSGLAYFLSVQPRVRLTYNLTNQDQYIITQNFNHPFRDSVYNYGIKFMPLFFIYPMIIVIGLISKREISVFQRKIANLSLIVFLLLLYLMTANITNFGVIVYKNFFRFSLFSMFRSYYSKFALVYIFFYSLVLGFSLKMVFENIILRWKKGLLSWFLIGLILFNGWPLISGKISNMVLWNSNNISSSIQMDPAYEQVLKKIENEKESLKVLSLPLTSENYQLLKGKEGGAYFGPTSIEFLAGKATFNGVSAFSSLWPQVKHLIEKKDYENLNKLFGLLNIGYVFYDSNNYIYDNFFLYPYSVWLKRVFPTQKEIGEFFNKLGTENIFSIDNYIFSKMNLSLLPRFYVPEKLVCSDGGKDTISEILSLDNGTRTAICLEDKNEKSDKNLSSYADGLFVKADIKDSWPFEIYENDLESYVFYPYVKKKNRLLWNLTILSEEYRKWLLRKSPKDLVEKKIFFANKRVNEAVSFPENETVEFVLYKKEIEGIFDVLKRIDDSNVRLRYVIRLILNLEDNFTKIKSSNLSNKNEWSTFTEKNIGKGRELEPEFSTSEIKYSAEIKRAGQYSIYLENTGVLDNLELLIEEKNITKNVHQENDHGLVKWGEVNLNKGLINLLIKVNKRENLLDENDWKIYLGKDKENTGLGVSRKQLSVYYYKDIINFQTDTWYEISEIPKTDTSIKFAVVEEDNFDEGKKRLKEAQEYVILQEADLGNKSWDRFFVRFDYGVKSAKIFLYGDNFEEKNLLENKKILDQIKLRPILEPKMILKLDNDQKNSFVEENSPKISFKKINSSKYLVKIDNKDKKLVSLILNESYHQGWKVYLNNRCSIFLKQCQEDFEEPIASYFNGEIRENKPQNKFFGKETFETLFKKPISLDNHYLINGYANLWLIDPKYFDDKGSCNLIIEFSPQLLFYFGLLIGFLAFSGCMIFLFYSIVKKKI